MRTVFAILWLLAMPASAQDGPSSALARFEAAYNATDPAAMAALFRADATFFGQSEPELQRGTEAVRGYFVRGWPPGTGRTIACTTLSLRQLGPGAASFVAACDTTRARPDGQREVRVLRLTGVVTRDAEGWRFADVHASTAPPPRR